MEKIKAAVYYATQKIVPVSTFQKMWAYYVKHNAKFDENRYRYPYVLSSKWGRKKQYFVFRYEYPQMGIVAAARSALMSCEWAEKNGMIPIVDYEWGYIYEDNKLGVENIWENIFEPIKLIEQVAEEDNVIVGHVNDTYSDALIREEFTGSKDIPWIRFVDNDWRESYKKLNRYAQKWWPFRKDVLKRFTEKYNMLFRPDMRILGVALREEFSLKREDVQGTLWEKHPHHLSIDEMIPLVKEYMRKWDCTHVFITTMVEESIQKFQEEFGEQCLFTKRKRLDKLEIYNKENMKINDKYMSKKGREYYEWLKSEDEYAKTANSITNKDTVIEYMEEIYGLSLCNCLLAGKSGSSFFACVWNGGKYDELEILSDEVESGY